MHSHGGGQAFGCAGEIHDDTVPVRQLGMHLPLDQRESAADAPVTSGDVGKVIEIVDLASGRDRLAAHATSTQTGDGEMVAPAVVIQGALSGRSRTVIGS